MDLIDTGTGDGDLISEAHLARGQNSQDQIFPPFRGSEPSSSAFYSFNISQGIDALLTISTGIRIFKSG